jgi:peroxiredoxin
MKRSLRILAGGLAAVVTAVVLGAAPAGAGPSAPDFKLKDLSGTTVRLSSFRGKAPVLLAFWATWCPYCRKQVPNLIRLREELGEQEVMIFGVNVGESKATARAFAESHDINYPVLLDRQSKVADRYGVSGIPFFVLISRDGNIAATDHTLSDRLVQAIRALD